MATFMLASCCWMSLSCPFTLRMRSPASTRVPLPVEFQRAMAPSGKVSSTSSWAVLSPGIVWICMPNLSVGPVRSMSTRKRSARTVPRGRQRATMSLGDGLPTRPRTSRAPFTDTMRSPTWSCWSEQPPSARRVSLSLASAGEILATSSAEASFAAPPQLLQGGVSSTASLRLRPSRQTMVASRWTSWSLRAIAMAKQTSSPLLSASWMAPALDANTPWPPLLGG
mmetsp:Transcript_54400/g.162030  ORF Transcript_54400/g.162030 Transcript_54400/m.162030 type:complete len:225 (-) Transcript_54400:1002-1676(-)